MWLRFKQLSSDSLIYGLGGAATKMVGLVLVPILTRAFQPEEYGVVETISATTMLLAVLFALGTDAAVGFYFFDASSEKDRRVLVSTWVIFQLVLSSVVCALLLGMSAPLSIWLFRVPDYQSALRLALVTLPFTLLLGIAMSILRLRFATRRYVLISVGVVATNAALSIFFVLVWQMNVTGVLLGNLLATALFALIALGLTYTNFHLQFSTNYLRELLYYGMPLVPAALAGWMINFASRYFILYTMPLDNVGLFVVGTKVASLVLLVVSAFQTAWGPFALALAKEPDARQIFARTLTYYLIATTGLALALAIFAEEILRVFTRAEYVGAYPIVGLLALSAIANGAYYIVAIGVNLTKQTAFISVTTIIASLVNLGANFALIPPFGLLGAATATLIGTVASTALLYGISQKYYPIDYEWRKVFKTLLLVGVAMIAGALARTSQPWLDGLFKLAILLGFAGALPVLGILAPSDLARVRTVLTNRLWSVKRDA